MFADVDFIDESAKISRRFFFSQGGFDCAALLVAENDDQRDVKMFDRVVDRAEDKRLGDVAGHADDEDFAEPLVKNDLGRNARIGAREHDRIRRLPSRQFLAFGEADILRFRPLGGEPIISVLKELPRLRGSRARFVQARLVCRMGQERQDGNDRSGRQSQQRRQMFAIHDSSS